MAVEKIGIMQPYFFPYIGYFDLIAAADHWVVFDPVQYIRKGWINRNRVLKKGGDWKYLGLTVKKASRDTLIRDIEISREEDVKAKLIRNLDYYELAKAPRYNEVVALIERSLDAPDDRISVVNSHIMKCVCDELEIPFSWSLYSEMELDHETPTHAGEWALNISKAMGAKVYINPPGGHAIFQPEQFQQAGIKLQYLQPELTQYDQKQDEFLPGLSVLDMLMFVSPDEIRNSYMKYSLEDA